MTKEQLLDSTYRREYRHNGVEHVSETVSLYDLKQFFSEHVCIPRGKTLQVNYGNGQWNDDITISHNYEYRIKPSKPTVAPKYKVGDRVTVTSYYDTFDSIVTEVKDGKYFFEQKLYLPIERQDAQMKSAEPIYEWHWLTRFGGDLWCSFDAGRFHTIEEMKDYADVKMIEETKRERR